MVIVLMPFLSVASLSMEAVLFVIIFLLREGSG